MRNRQPKDYESILWCSSHYRLDGVKRKIKELRATGEYLKVFACDYLKEDDRNGELQTYAKIRLHIKKEENRA